VPNELGHHARLARTVRAAFDVEFQQWVDSVAEDTPAGPSSWDGYAATVIGDADGRGFAFRSDRRRT